MKKNKSFKYRFYPNKEQTEMLNQTFGCVRYVWNQVLDWRSKEYSLHGNKINYCSTSKRLTELKKEKEWLKSVSSIALQQGLRNQDSAFSNFFKKRAKYPTFKKKINNQSFRLTNGGFVLKEGKVYIAKCREPLAVRWSRHLEGKTKSITISKDSVGRFHVSFCNEVEIEPLCRVSKSVGIDLGLTDFAITSDGEKIKSLKCLTKNQAKLKKYQRRLSKKTKGSNRRNKARIKVAKIHAKISDSRNNFLHKLSAKLINENQVICIEDLNVAGMIRNRKLAKAIVDASWSKFVNMIEYKAEWYGRTVVKISPWYPSSQICSSCGILSGKKPLNIREWTCQKCGVKHDRDINASINIHTAGLAEINAQGDTSTGANAGKTVLARHVS